MSWFGTQRSFFFLSGCKACGPGANVHASKICIKLCFSHSGKDTEPALSSAWVTRHESNATHSLSLCLRLPLSHSFGTIIPLFNWAVWSCFTPVHPHWLPFCPISPPLIRLSVINNDRQKMAVHSGALVPPRCQRCSSTPHAYTPRSS